MSPRQESSLMDTLLKLFRAAPRDLKLPILGMLAFVLFVVFDKLNGVAAAIFLAFGTLALFVGLALAVNATQVRHGR